MGEEAEQSRRSVFFKSASSDSLPFPAPCRIRARHDFTDSSDSAHVRTVARVKAMASVTLGQHPARHHLDSEKLFRKLADEGKKLMRKPSREKMTRERAAAAAAAAAPRVQLSPRAPSDSGGETALRMCDSTGADPPQSVTGPRHADRDPAAHCAPECAGNEARSRSDAQNANRNNNGILRSHPRRSSAKNLNEVSGGRRVKFRSLSADGDALEGIQLERLTQARGGVVKLMRTEQPRRQAWSIFDQDEPRVKAERGEGHLFAPRRVTQDWCDACNRQIKSTALRCECELVQE